MKKKNIFLLSAICVLFVVFVSGLIVYAFKLQGEKDKQDKAAQELAAGTGGTKTAENFEDSVTTSDNTSPAQNSTAVVTPTVKVTPAPVPGPSLTPAPTNTGTENADSSGNNPIVLAFAGDVNFNEESKPVLRYDSKNKGILGGLSSGLVKEMKDADLMMLNNEFPYSTRGTKTPDKSYTFRANPDRVEILKEMGVDIVSLANNHSLDYGQDALLDTFTTLDNAGIDYVGAGKNVDRAIAPVYYTVGNKKIAYLAASRVIFAMDWYATDTRPGMIGTYEPTQFLEAIKEAAKNSDYVVVYVHWGVEKESFPEDYQRSLAKKYIDAGADVVVGSHPHVMQNIEFYKGKPIAYSLGNFWFNSNTQYSGLLKVYLNSDGSMRTQLLPVMAENTYSYLLDKENEKKAYFDYMQNLSDSITIDKDGFITEKQ